MRFSFEILTIIDSHPRKIQATSTSAAFPIETRQGMEQRNTVPFYADSDVFSDTVVTRVEWRVARPCNAIQAIALKL